MGHMLIMININYVMAIIVVVVDDVIDVPKPFGNDFNIRVFE